MSAPPPECERYTVRGEISVRSSRRRAVLAAVGLLLSSLWAGCIVDRTPEIMTGRATLPLAESNLSYMLGGDGGWGVLRFTPNASAWTETPSGWELPLRARSAVEGHYAVIVFQERAGVLDRGLVFPSGTWSWTVKNSNPADVGLVIVAISPPGAAATPLEFELAGGSGSRTAVGSYERGSGAFVGWYEETRGEIRHQGVGVRDSRVDAAAGSKTPGTLEINWSAVNDHNGLSAVNGWADTRGVRAGSFRAHIEIDGDERSESTSVVQPATGQIVVRDIASGGAVNGTITLHVETADALPTLSLVTVMVPWDIVASGLSLHRDFSLTG